MVSHTGWLNRTRPPPWMRSLGSGCCGDPLETPTKYSYTTHFTQVWFWMTISMSRRTKIKWEIIRIIFLLRYSRFNLAGPHFERHLGNDAFPEGIFSSYFSMSLSMPRGTRISWEILFNIFSIWDIAILSSPQPFWTPSWKWRLSGRVILGDF